MSTTLHVTVDEFDRMIKSGVFDERPNRRIELIEGELREMSPVPDSDHEYIVDLLNRWSGRVLPALGVLVRVQNSIGIPELDSVPVPDLAWVIERDYRRQRPTAEDVLLIIEVAKSSLRYDRGRKAKIYAKAGIRDYWVVNIPDEIIEVFREPKKRGYAEPIPFARGEKVKPLALPKVNLAVEELFG